MNRIDDLRDELLRLGQNPARLHPLIRLGQELMDAYNRLGAGTPAAKPFLDEAVDLFHQAYAMAQAADAMRGAIASMLGPTLAARYGAYGGDVQDRETGIRVMEEALSLPGVVEPRRATTQLALGHLYLGLVLAYSPLEGFSVLTPGTGTGPSEPAMADTDRAIDCFRGVLDSRSGGTDLATAARTLMGVAETARTMLDGSRLTGVLATLQTLGEKVSAGSILNMDLSTLLRAVSTGRPVAVREAPPVLLPAPIALPDVVELRHSLYALLPYGSPQGWPAAVALLQPGTPAPATALVNELAALAQLIVDRSDPDEAQSALDHYFLAVTLLLRDRGDETSRGDDRAAGLDELLVAARTIPLVHPAALAVLRSLGAFVNEAQPLDKVLGGVAGQFADRLDSAILAGVAQGVNLAVLDALRCLCRAAEALENLRRAAEKVPADYPWPSMAAARQVAIEAA